MFSERPGSCENGFDKNIGRPCVPEGRPGCGATKEPRELSGMREEGGVWWRGWMEMRTCVPKSRGEATSPAFCGQFVVGMQQPCVFKLAGRLGGASEGSPGQVI